MSSAAELNKITLCWIF